MFFVVAVVFVVLGFFFFRKSFLDDYDALEVIVKIKHLASRNFYVNSHPPKPEPQHKTEVFLEFS